MVERRRGTGTTERGRRQRRSWATVAAPVAFLLGVTIAILLVRSALNEGAGGPARETRPVATRPAPRHGKAYARVKPGDTFASIARRFGITVARLQRLNPRARSTSLFIGQRIRVR